MQNPIKETKPGDISKKTEQEQKLARGAEPQKQPLQQDNKQEQKR